MKRAAAYPPGIERFDPLDQVLCYDDFNDGQAGWLDLRPNFVLPEFREHSREIDLTHWGPTMISSATFPFMGTHGAMSGTYSLKLSTRPTGDRHENPPAPGSMGLAIKRLATHRPLNHIQMEAWFTYTPEQDRFGIGDADVRAFGFFFDLQDAEHRWMPGIRYLNSANGELRKRWQYFRAADVTDAEWNYGHEGWHRRGVDSQWFGRRYADGSGDGFVWVPDGDHKLVFNESADKINWMYLRLLVDVPNRKYVEFQAMDRTFDLRGNAPTLAPVYESITGLINPVFFVETDTDRRVFLFVDSVVISVD